MTTVELAQRLVKDLDEKDLTLVTMDTKTSLVDAMNAGIQRYYNKCGPFHKSISASVVVNAPKTITIDVTEGSNQFSGYVVTEDDIYCAVIIDGDTIQNQLVGDGELMDVYTGSSGSKSATIYYDAIPIYQPIVRVTSDPYILEKGASIFKANLKDDILRRWTSKVFGYPEYYTVENNATSENSQAAFLLRLDRLPSSRFRLRMDVEVSALRVTLNHFINPINIPVRENHIESYLIPMIRDSLTTSPMWRDKTVISKISEQAQKAEVELEMETVRNAAPQGNRVGTPQGF